jgi:hypothetical protein
MDVFHFGTSLKNSVTVKIKAHALHPYTNNHFKVLITVEKPK